jgi:hypothetical protein
VGFIIILTGTLPITDTITTDHIDTITTIITDVHTEELTITEVIEPQQPLEEVTLLVAEGLQLLDVLPMFIEEVIVEPIVMTEILVLQEVHEGIIQDGAATLTTEVLNDQLEQEVIILTAVDLPVTIEVHLAQQEVQEDILPETIELPIIMMFVNLHQFETLEVVILRETKVLIELLKNHILQETLKAIQNQLEITEETTLLVRVAIQENLEVIRNHLEVLVVTLLHQEAALHLEVAREEVAEVHQEALEDNL